MTTAEKLDVRRISPESIAPDPENPRMKLRNLEDLTASVKLHGVLEPITVRPNPSPNGTSWIVVRGHRRHAAALKAGVDGIPCVCDFSDDAKLRAQHRLVENLQRDDLSATEQAKGVQQLLDLGLSDEEVAAGLSVSTAHVERARAIAGSKRVAKIDKKPAVALTFDQAAAIAEFEDDEEWANELADLAETDPGYFEQQLEQFRRERERHAAIEAKEKELRDLGYTILSGSPFSMGGKMAQLSELKTSKDAKGNLTKTTHAKCPGRGAWVRFSGTKVEVTEGCADWKKHGHLSNRPDPRRVPAKQSAAKKTGDQQKAEEIVKACVEAAEAAQAVRRRFVGDLLGRTSVPKGTMAYVTRAIVLGDDVWMDWSEFAALLDAPKSKKIGIDKEPVTTWFESLSENRLPLALLGLVACTVEWEAKDWDSKWSKDERTKYLEFLVSIGYTPSLIEKVILGEAKPGDVLAEADRIKAAAKG